MGMIYKRGEVFWIKYYKNGKPYRESSKSTKETAAKRLLKLRGGEITQGKIPGFYFEKVRFEELAEDFVRDRRINNKSVSDAQKRLNNLAPFFKDMRGTDITTLRINAYVDRRLNQGAENGTINRELAALKRMLKLGERHDPPEVGHVPHIEMLEENNAREGFFEDIGFETLRAALPSELHGFVTFGFLTGWRYQEIAGLEWERVDMNNRTIRLRAQDTKGTESRLMKMEPSLFEIMEEQLSKKHKASSYVFHKDGEKLEDI
jgi:integrase